MLADSMRQVLEAALGESPDDLAAHMAFGDYLAERGDPLGEFIQVQLGLEDTRLPAERRAELKRREKELLAAHQVEWLGPFARLFGGGARNDCTWRRGWLDEVRIGSLGEDEARLLRGCPAARLLRSLNLPHVRHRLVQQRGHDEEDEEDEEAEELPRQDAPGQLHLFEEGAAQAPAPPRPERPISPLVLLAGAAFLPNLRQLQVGPPEAGMDEEEEAPGTSLGLGTLLEGGAVARLEVLSVGAPGARAQELFTARMPRLHTLLLHRVSGRLPLRLLANNPGMPALRVLHIHPGRHVSETVLETDDVLAFARSPHFPALRELHLRGHDLGVDGCQAFGDSGIFRRVRKLDLSRGTITDRGARVLARCRDIPRLESLTLLYNSLSERGIARLQALPIEVACEIQDEPFSEDME